VVEKSSRPTIALIGDSHAAALGPGLRKQVAKYDFGIDIVTKSSCGSLIGVNISHERMPMFAQSCATYMEQAVQYVIMNASIKTVILAANWDGYSGVTPSFQDGLTSMVSKLSYSERAVIIVRDVPHWDIDPVHLAYAESIFYRGFIANMMWSDNKDKFPVNGHSSMNHRQSHNIDTIFHDVAIQ